ncbi:response regulator [Hydrogenimonas sp.]
MNILIIENEIYLAQSIAQKLGDLGHECDIFATVSDALDQKTHYEAVLLSTNLSDQDIYPVIKRYADSIVLLIVSYISNDTVTEPLKAGAMDYIQKPFMIEELVRKIDHYHSYKLLQNRCAFYDEYIYHQMKNIQLPKEMPEHLPVMIKTNYQKQADAFAFAIAKKRGRPLVYMPMGKPGALKKIAALKTDAIIYAPEFQMLKKSEKLQFLEDIKGKNVIVSTTESFSEEYPPVIELLSDHKIFDRSEILTIDDYVKFIIHNYQSKFPDTELSKKLGISRKSLWEKRKKYGLFKKK